MASSSEAKPGPAMPVAWHRRFPPRTVLAVLGALALLDAGFYAAAVRPAQRGDEAARARIDRLARQVAVSRRGFEEVVAAAERIEQAESAGTELALEIALPRRSAFSALLTELGAAAEAAGVQIRETSYGLETIEGSEGYGILAVDANFRGRYESLVQLLYHLDRSELFFVISSLAATPRDGASSGDLRINMRFDTFVRDL